MSAYLEPESADADPQAPSPAGAVEGEEIDALPVLAAAETVTPAYPARSPGAWRGGAAVMPAAQAAAVAAGGFVAGAALVGLVHRRQRRLAASSRGRSSRRARRRRGQGGVTSLPELVQIVGSRSLLVDVHLLGARD